jgi:hypothetical protein
MFLPPRRRGTLRSQWSFIVQPEEKPSLYDRLGGVNSIAAVVDDFINRIMVDPKLNANPLVGKAHHRVPPSGLQVPSHRDGLLGHRRSAELRAGGKR